MLVYVYTNDMIWGGNDIVYHFRTNTHAIPRYDLKTNSSWSRVRTPLSKKRTTLYVSYNDPLDKMALVLLLSRVVICEREAPDLVRKEFQTMAENEMKKKKNGNRTSRSLNAP